MRVTPNVEEIGALNQLYRTLVTALIDVVGLAGEMVEVEVTHHGNFRGFDGDKFYVVEQGTLSARLQFKEVYTLEEGDILLPDITGPLDQEMAVFFGSETGARLRVFSALDFMQRIFDDPMAIRIWTRLMITYAGLMLRTAAARIPEDPPATPGFEVYEEGQDIIVQGDRADFVFHMSAGIAEVFVDNIPVGRIGEGEIFGAMAALTQADRSATDRAKGRCEVVKVPKEQFTELIKNNPATIHSLLVDMANSVVNLNEQLVALRAKTK